MGISQQQKAGYGEDAGSRRFSSRAFSAFEFDVFCLAGKAHNVEQDNVFEDFRRYLLEGSVPEYVAAFSRPPGTIRGKTDA